MRSSKLLLLLSPVITASKFDVRRLKPEDAGLLHTDAFDQLAELYKEKAPGTKLDLMMDLSGIMAGYCDEDDEECRALAYEATLKKFYSKRIDPSDLEYPDIFDMRLKESMDDMFEVISEINEGNVDDIVDSLNDITGEMRDMGDVNMLQREIALSALSIAVESTKLWHNVYIKDHPLQRRMQDLGLLDINDFVNQTNTELLGGTAALLYEGITADVAAALDKGTAMVKVYGTSSLDIIVRLVPIALLSVTYFAIPASCEKGCLFF